MQPAARAREVFGLRFPWYTLGMDSSVKIDVASLDPAHRQAMEDVLGLQLQTNQRLIIQVATVDLTGASDQQANVMDLVTHFYDGVDAEEVEEIDTLIKTRANLTRPLS